MARLLVVHHSPTAATRALSEAVLAGARDDAITGVTVTPLEALAFARDEAGPEDLVAADGYLLLTPANFGYMSGALKHMFDATFLHIGGALDDSGGGDADGAGATKGRPFGLLVHGRYDTTGAVRSVLSFTGALGWRQGYDVVEVLGEVTGADRERAYELGGTIAALLSD